MRTTRRYLISYVSPGAISGTNQIKLEVHYAGLGGFGYAEYVHSLAGSHLARALHCYPNPFNPTIQILVNLEESAQGVVEIFNILGQRVRSFPLKPSKEKCVIHWDARELATGTYLVCLNIFGKDGKFLKNETAKVLYIK
ncbi:MAG: T9SS type A sorting domain-containing protein [candidate division KSB1 bacterium]|nr:T9SS type A sorting domain-containing protein [candidate division KSB1 bacterium]